MKLFLKCCITAFFVKLLVLGDPNYEAKFQSIMSKVKSGACQHLYMDLGSNIGIQIRKLYQPEYYRKAPILRYYMRTFGFDRKSVCSIGFEGNPAHTNPLNIVQKGYNDAGYHCTIFTETAVSTVDGPTAFYSDIASLPIYKQWGASLEFRRGTHAEHANSSVYGVDFNKFFLKVYDVWTQTSNYSPTKSKVMVKVDVEGSEQELMPHLLAGGSLCKMNVIISEWHPRMDNVKSIEPHLRAVISRVRTCKHEMINLDDETYGDGNHTVPFPPPIRV